MKVITGTARGKKLKTLEGEATRPTSSMVKESIFNIIQFEIEGRRVLDLFGGSGQFAIEAISRGALNAVVCDISKNAVAIITDNVKSCGFTDAVSIIQANYTTALRGKFDIIFLDPPYASNLLNQALNDIHERDVLSDGGVIICESARDSKHNSPYGAGREYIYGKTKITVYRKEVTQ